MAIRLHYTPSGLGTALRGGVLGRYGAQGQRSPWATFFGGTNQGGNVPAGGTTYTNPGAEGGARANQARIVGSVVGSMTDGSRLIVRGVDGNYYITDHQGIPIVQTNAAQATQLISSGQFVEYHGSVNSDGTVTWDSGMSPADATAIGRAMGPNTTAPTTTTPSATTPTAVGPSSSTTPIGTGPSGTGPAPGTTTPGTTTPGTTTPGTTTPGTAATTTPPGPPAPPAPPTPPAPAAPTLPPSGPNAVASGSATTVSGIPDLPPPAPTPAPADPNAVASGSATTVSGTPELPPQPAAPVPPPPTYQSPNDIASGPAVGVSGMPAPPNEPSAGTGTMPQGPAPAMPMTPDAITPTSTPTSLYDLLVASPDQFSLTPDQISSLQLAPIPPDIFAPATPPPPSGGSGSAYLTE